VHCRAGSESRLPSPVRHNPKAAALGGLDRACDALLALEPADPERLLCATAHARERAERSLSCFAPGEPAAETVLNQFAGVLMAGLLADPDSPPEPAVAALARLEEAGLVTAAAAAHEALRCPSLLALEPASAIECVLRLLVACAGARSVSLWGAGATGRLAPICWAGEEPRRGPAPRLARELIAGESAPPRRRGAVGVAVRRAGLPAAALVASPRAGAVPLTRGLLEDASPTLAAVLERQTLLARNASSERALLQASERRLTRLGFDLHDGPLQELLLVGEDLALFREQLGVVLEGRSGKELLGGRLDDLDARLVSLERAMRRISTSVHASAIEDRPFADSFEDMLSPFRSRTGILPEVELAGDLDGISTSQRMALLSVIGEALNNIREHSRARAVSISIVSDEDGVRARVVDDGLGFDVEEELLRAARRGHMGLAGVYERVRLLGGHCRIESRRGGPSEITVALPRWQAPPAERAAAGA
jgi:signal transduction histidine kinase